MALISEDMALRLPASIAGCHLLTIGQYKRHETVDAVAEKLAMSEDRRILLAFLAAAMFDRDPERSAKIAVQLPNGHPARRWAAGENLDISRDMLIDLGDASAVNEALGCMKADEN